MDRRLFEFAVYSSLLLLKKSFYAFFLTAVYLAFIPLVYYTTNKRLGGVSTTSPPRPGVYSGPGVKSGKYGKFRLAKQQLCTCITLFCTFLCRHCTTTKWTRLLSSFVEDVNTRQRLSFSFPEPRYSLLEFSSRKNCQKNVIKFEAAQLYLLSDVFVVVAFVVA